MNPVRWFEIYVEEMERARIFYQNIFHVALTKLDNTELDMWGFPADMDTYGTTGALVKMPGLKPGGASTIIYFGSEDCAIEEKRVTQFGGKIHKPKMSIGHYGFITLAIDTEGNMFGIHSMK